MAEDRQALAMQYMQLLQSGVPAAEAFKQVYPKGIPTAAQQAREDSKTKQGNALAGTGGTIAGLLGIKYGTKALESLGAEKAKEEIIKEGTAQALEQGAAEVGKEAAVQGAAEAAPSVLGNFGSMGFGPQAGIVAGTALTAKGLSDLAQNKKGDPLSRGVTAMSTFGFSEMGRALGLGGHKSTRQEASDRTNELLKASDDPAYQAYVQGMRKQYESAPTGPAFNGGQFNTFDEYKKAGLNAQDLSGVYGNLKLGADYVALPQELKNAFTQSQIDKGNYQSKKGDVLFIDEKTAQNDFSNFISGVQKPQAVVGSAIARPVAEQSDAFKKKQLALNGQFGNQLLQAINK